MTPHTTEGRPADTGRPSTTNPHTLQGAQVTSTIVPQAADKPTKYRPRHTRRRARLGTVRAALTRREVKK